MPKRQDPRTQALSYFATADVDQAIEDARIVTTIAANRKRALAPPPAVPKQRKATTRAAATPATPGPQTTVGS